MYVANQDGFSTQRKQGVGTCDYEMVNAFGVRIITNTNSRSSRHVDTICFIPGVPIPSALSNKYLRCLHPPFRAQATTTNGTGASPPRT